jgi:hypothetical protein
MKSLELLFDARLIVVAIGQRLRDAVEQEGRRLFASRDGRIQIFSGCISAPEAYVRPRHAKERIRIVYEVHA